MSLSSPNNVGKKLKVCWILNMEEYNNNTQDDYSVLIAISYQQGIKATTTATKRYKRRTKN